MASVYASGPAWPLSKAINPTSSQLYLVSDVFQSGYTYIYIWKGADIEWFLSCSVMQHEQQFDNTSMWTHAKASPSQLGSWAKTKQTASVKPFYMNYRFIKDILMGCEGDVHVTFPEFSCQVPSCDHIAAFIVQLNPQTAQATLWCISANSMMCVYCDNDVCLFTPVSVCPSG